MHEPIIAVRILTGTRGGEKKVHLICKDQRLFTIKIQHRCSEYNQIRSGLLSLLVTGLTCADSSWMERVKQPKWQHL